MNKIACAICRSSIAYADDLSLPLKNTMFTSLMPENGVPDPFPLDGWLSFRCPYCKHRPFIEEHEIPIVDDAGFMSMLDLKADLKPHKCECGAAYQNKQSLVRHKKDCKWKN